MPTTLQHFLSQAIPALQRTAGLEAPGARLEAQLLLQHVLQVERAYLLAHPERILSAAEERACQALLQRRLAGEPMAYLLGNREFYGLSLLVSPATLIPRPDTELLVELALQRLPETGVKHVLDLGTGSGAIVLALAKYRPESQFIAVDAAPDALAVAQENARRLDIRNVEFLAGHWFDPLPGRHFDLIVSNPPYIAADDPHLTQGDLRFEPRSALVSGADGLDDLRLIVAKAATHLQTGGWLMLEHGHDQADAVRKLLHAAGYTEIASVRDLAGIERVSLGRLGSSSRTGIPQPRAHHRKDDI